MLFVQRRPAPPLDSAIECIWLCRSEPRPRTLERVLPIGAAQLIVNLAEDQTRVYETTSQGLVCHTAPGSILTGVTPRCQTIDTAEQEWVAGVAFRAGGATPFTGVPASELGERDVPLECVWGRHATARLREQLLAAPTPDAALDAIERALIDAYRPRLAHPAVSLGLRTFQADPLTCRIATVADAAGLSSKRFSERFRAEVGLTPKRYCRLLRFRQAVARAHASRAIDWAELAADCGYFDQAHFIHEFRAFSGMTPTVYEARRTAFESHVTFLQSDAD